MSPLFIVGVGVAVFVFLAVSVLVALAGKSAPPVPRCLKCGQTVPAPVGIGQKTRADLCPNCTNNVSDSASPTLRPEITALYRPAWQPVVRDGDDRSTDSKFCGAPYLPPGEAWPMCGKCDVPLQLFVQLNTSTLPAPVQKDVRAGVYQLFYCTSDKNECETWDLDSPGIKVRRIDIPDEAPPLPAVPASLTFPARSITGWTEVPDLPNWEELQSTGIEITDAEEKILENLQLPLTGDKLSGWPAWVQGVEYPSCRACGSKMRLLFQVDSEDHVPYMFGDVGCGHITQCEEHQDQLAFGWACC